MKSVCQTGGSQLQNGIPLVSSWLLAAQTGCEVKVVSRWFPSSKTCSSCGTIKETLDFCQRVLVCEDCGYVADRDYNAAKTRAAAG